jgi:Abnormal spindle-like microcephaly-assoc'd, ASPM-SPD-2-Hydin
MLLLPQCNFRALLCLAICITTICPLRAIALAEKQPVQTPGPDGAQTQLTCATGKIQFGDIAVGQTSDKLVTIINSGVTPLIVLSATSTGTEFRLNGLDLPLTLAEGESFTFRVTFAPDKSGPVRGRIAIVSGPPEQTLTIQVAGTSRAAGQLQVTPAAIDFGDTSVGLSGTQRGELTANGAPVTVSSATISSENFRLDGLSLPVTIPAGHSVPFTVTFVPRDSKISSAILSFESDAENASTEHAVTVRVVRPAQHKVQLSWKASTSKHIQGYNVYRGNHSGGPYKKVNVALDPYTKFTDLTVAAGHRYYYVATAVNSRKRESHHSKQIQVMIP